MCKKYNTGNEGGQNHSEQNSDTEHNNREYSDYHVMAISAVNITQSVALAYWRQSESLSTRLLIKAFLILHRTFYSCKPLLQIVNVRHLICCNIASTWLCSGRHLRVFRSLQIAMQKHSTQYNCYLLAFYAEMHHITNSETQQSLIIWTCSW